MLKIGDEVVNGRQPKDRDLAMVFQSYELYPLVIGACAGLVVGDAYSQSASTGPRPSSRHPNGDRRGEP